MRALEKKLAAQKRLEDREQERERMMVCKIDEYTFTFTYTDLSRAVSVQVYVASVTVVLSSVPPAWLLFSPLQFGSLFRLHRNGKEKLGRMTRKEGRIR